jgi:hypothetical protein
MVKRQPAENYISAKENSKVQNGVLNGVKKRSYRRKVSTIEPGHTQYLFDIFVEIMAKPK